MTTKHYLQRGFTIVELLIVIVIIGILATISIVAYNGVQNNAHKTAVMSDLDNSAAIMAHDIIANGIYATSTTAADGGKGLPTNSGTNYQYTFNNAATPPTFCLTGTNGSVSYYINSNTDTPTKGGCPGDGVNGVPPITNLASNPRATSSTIANGTFGWSFRWAGSGGAQTTSAVTGASDGPLTGVSTYLRKTWTVIGSGLQDIAFTYSYGGTAGYPVHPNDTYMISSYFRFSRAVSINTAVNGVQFDWYDSSGTKLSSSRTNISLTTANANTWYRVSGTATAPANAVYLTAYHNIYLSSASALSVGDTLDGTALVVTKDGKIYNYSDPITTASWEWNGTPNASTSTGPVQ